MAPDGGASSDTDSELQHHEPPKLLHLHVTGGKVEVRVSPVETAWKCSVNGNQVADSAWSGGTLRLSELTADDLAEVSGPSISSLRVEGAATLTGDIRQRGRLQISVAGESAIQLGGRVSYLMVSHRGSGEVCCEMLRASWAWLSLSSTGTLRATSLKQVRIDKTGAGRLVLNSRLAEGHPDRDVILGAGWGP